MIRRFVWRLLGIDLEKERLILMVDKLKRENERLQAAVNYAGKLVDGIGGIDLHSEAYG